MVDIGHKSRMVPQLITRGGEVDVGPKSTKLWCVRGLLCLIQLDIGSNLNENYVIGINSIVGPISQYINE